jgi:hypothetical protein
MICALHFSFKKKYASMGSAIGVGDVGQAIGGRGGGLPVPYGPNSWVFFNYYHNIYIILPAMFD